MTSTRENFTARLLGIGKKQRFSSKEPIPYHERVCQIHSNKAEKIGVQENDWVTLTLNQKFGFTYPVEINDRYTSKGNVVRIPEQQSYIKLIAELNGESIKDQSVEVSPGRRVADRVKLVIHKRTEEFPLVDFNQWFNNLVFTKGLELENFPVIYVDKLAAKVAKGMDWGAEKSWLNTRIGFKVLDTLPEGPVAVSPDTSIKADIL